MALAKLRPDNEPVISTWSVSQISKNVKEILEELKTEYDLKKVVVGMYLSLIKNEISFKIIHRLMMQTH